MTDYTSQRYEPNPYIRDHPKPNGSGHAIERVPAPVVWTDMSRWDDGDPPDLEWSITDILPREQIGLSSGVGGAGKTTLELLKTSRTSSVCLGSIGCRNE